MFGEVTCVRQQDVGSMGNVFSILKKQTHLLLLAIVTLNTEGYVIHLSKEVHPVTSQGGCRIVFVYNTHTVLG